MIRFLLAILLTVALLGVAMTAVDTGATITSERTVESQISTIDRQALELLRTEERPSPGQDGPTRTIQLTLPSEGLLTDAVTRFVVIPSRASDRSTVSYQVSGGQGHQVSLDAPLVTEDGSRLRLDGESGTLRVKLELQTTPDGRSVVSLSVL